MFLWFSREPSGIDYDRFRRQDLINALTPYKKPKPKINKNPNYNKTRTQLKSRTGYVPWKKK
jgi:hypothetical protein